LVNLNLLICCHDFLPLDNVNLRLLSDDKERSIKELMTIPSIGKSIANDLWEIGITSIEELKGKDPEFLYHHQIKLREWFRIGAFYTVSLCSYYVNTHLKTLT